MSGVSEICRLTIGIRQHQRKLSIEIHSQAGEYVGEVGVNKFLNVRVVSRPRQKKKTHSIFVLRGWRSGASWRILRRRRGTFVQGLGRAKCQEGIDRCTNFQAIRGSKETKYS
jgi:hypothetical protein